MIQAILIVFSAAAVLTIAWILHELLKPLPPVHQREYRIITNGSKYNYSAQVNTKSIFGWADVQWGTTYLDQEAAEKAIERHKAAWKVVKRFDP